MSQTQTTDTETSETPVERGEVPKVDFIDWLLFPIFVFAFLLVLLVFELLQRVARLFGSRAQQHAAVHLSLWLRACLFILGTKIRVTEPRPGFLESLSSEKPYIVVSTHQSLFDICILASIFKKHFPHFVSKKELKWLFPSVSYNLRAGGAALIDRKNPRQAIPELKRFAAHMLDQKFLAVIFPEGTRARDGRTKEFQLAGLTVLLASAPEVEVIPVFLNGTWKLSYRKFGPIPRGVDVTVDIFPLLERSERDSRSLAAKACEVITSQSASV